MIDATCENEKLVVTVETGKLQSVLDLFHGLMGTPKILNSEQFAAEIAYEIRNSTESQQILFDALNDIMHTVVLDGSESAVFPFELEEDQ